MCGKNPKERKKRKKKRNHNISLILTECRKKRTQWPKNQYHSRFWEIEQNVGANKHYLIHHRDNKQSNTVQFNFSQYWSGIVIFRPDQQVLAFNNYRMLTSLQNNIKPQSAPLFKGTTRWLIKRKNKIRRLWMAATQAIPFQQERSVPPAPEICKESISLFLSMHLTTEYSNQDKNPTSLNE